MIKWWRISKPWKTVVNFWFLTQNDEDVLLFSHQTSSMKHHLTETHEHNFEIYMLKLLYNLTTEDRSCHEVEWSENILCGGRHLI